MSFTTATLAWDMNGPRIQALQGSARRRPQGGSDDLGRRVGGSNGVGTCSAARRCVGLGRGAT